MAVLMLLVPLILLVTLLISTLCYIDSLVLLLILLLTLINILLITTLILLNHGCTTRAMRELEIIHGKKESITSRKLRDMPSESKDFSVNSFSSGKAKISLSCTCIHPKGNMLSQTIAWTWDIESPATI